MEFDRGQLRVGLGVEGVDVLGDDAGDDAQGSQIPDGVVGGVGAGAVEVRPPEETAGPVPLAGLVGGGEFVVVDWSVGFVEGVGSPCAAVVGEA